MEEYAGRVIDFHIHLPHRYEDPVEAAGYLVRVLDRAGVRLAVVIAIEAGLETFRRHATPREVKRAIGDVLDYVSLSRIPMLSKLVYDTEAGLRDHERILLEHIRPTREIVEAARAYPDRLLPVASYCPDRGVEATIREKILPYREELLGVKIYPTLHYTKPSDSRLAPLYKAVGDMRGIVIVHTGCDPGLWELPRMCRLARPRYVAEAARRFRDVVFVIAHMGAYSALMPGIFFHEALQAVSLDNVYMDASAVDPFFVERAVDEVGYDKILFGSDYPYMIGFDVADSIRAILGLDLSEEAKRAILYENAERLLRALGRL